MELAKWNVNSIILFGHFMVRLYFILYTPNCRGRKIREKDEMKEREFCQRKKNKERKGVLIYVFNDFFLGQVFFENLNRDIFVKKILKHMKFYKVC
jgi:hypothetical protein